MVDKKTLSKPVGLSLSVSKRALWIGARLMALIFFFLCPPKQDSPWALFPLKVDKIIYILEYIKNEDKNKMEGPSTVYYWYHSGVFDNLGKDCGE